MDKRLKELAEQAGLEELGDSDWCSLNHPDVRAEHLERFANLVRQDEREANAKLADDFERLEYEAVGDPRVPAFKSLIGESIRARGNHEQD
jgi:hypothetical protein